MTTSPTRSAVPVRYGSSFSMPAATTRSWRVCARRWRCAAASNAASPRRQEAEPGTLIVHSAKEGEAAVDGDGINSPFAQAFMKRLKTPGREVQRMFDDVLKATGKRQQPYKYGSLTGERDFFFVAGK
jgi:uncharacterized caspase-like protein